jgi:hypothetical protein
MKAAVLITSFLFAGLSCADDMYVRDQSLNAGGSYLVDEVEVPPRFLVERFGAPADGDGIRVSGEYTFRSPQGVVFTIHDYKATSLWATDEGLPTPEEFWRSTVPMELSIGARGDDAGEFKTWILAEYRAWLKGNEGLSKKTKR